MAKTKGHPDILKIVEKNILQRKDKLKKIENESRIIFTDKEYQWHDYKAKWRISYC